MIQHRDPLSFILISKNHIYHQFTGTAKTKLHIPHKTGVIPDIIETQFITDSIFFQSQPDSVGWFSLQMTFFDINYLVKKALYMVAGHILESRKVWITHFFRQQISLIAKGVFYFIAII